MAKFRMVYLDFWTDPKVVEEMTPEDKYFFLYLLTNPKTTQAGIYKITKKQMAFDTGYSPESINALLERFQSHHKLILYNPTTRELAIRHWGKYNLNRGGKPVIDCIKSELKEVHDTTLIEYVGKCVESSNIKVLYDTYTTRTTISGQEEEKEEEEEEEEEKEEQEEVLQTSQSLSFFSKEFNLLPSSFMIEHLLKLVDEYTDNWTLKALETALMNNNRSLSYVEGILKKWKERGSDAPWDSKKPTEPQTTKQGKPQIPTVQSSGGQAVTIERARELAKQFAHLEGGNT